MEMKMNGTQRLTVGVAITAAAAIGVAAHFPLIRHAPELARNSMVSNRPAQPPRDEEALPAPAVSKSAKDDSAQSDLAIASQEELKSDAVVERSKQSAPPTSAMA